MRLLALISILLVAADASAAVIYVNSGASGLDNGSSWPNAYRGLQSALAAASAGDEVWVSSGTYHPGPAPTSQGQHRGLSFDMKTGVSIYGGFSGIETTRAQRDWVAHLTILSGDLLDNDGAEFANTSDNSYHVVTATNVVDCTLDGFTVTGGHADGDALGANPESKDQGSGANVYYASPHFENIIFEKNWASNHGAVNDHGDSTLTHCTFRNNYALLLGAGLYMHTNSTARASVCVFTTNTTPADGAGAYSRSQHGATIANSTFTLNRANDGAGMYNAEGSSSSITGCTFTSNFAATGGGGIFANFASPTVSSCFFTLNRAGENIAAGDGGGGGSGGGGFWASGGSPTVSDCTFTNNLATFGGGAYFNEASTGLVQRCTFTNNSANEAGGLYILTSNVTARDCTFTGNAATGGSFAVGGGLSDYFSNATILDCTFIANHSIIGGGGLYIEGETPFIANCLFARNFTTGVYEGWGGGLLAGFNTNAFITDCAFVANTGHFGGGLANAVFSNATITNCTWTANTSTAETGHGGAIHSFDPSTPTLRNSIAWNNFPANLSGEITASNSCIGERVQGVGNLSLDPMFSRPPSAGADQVWGTEDDDLGDLTLQRGSPCIDAGDSGAIPAQVITDLAKNPRFFDAASVPDTGPAATPAPVDLGAYEYQGSSCSPDFDGDGDVGTDADIEAFFACLAGNCCRACVGPDFNSDGDAGTDADIESFFRVMAGGTC